MASRGPTQAVQSLATALKGINGTTGGYWYNLQDRVYEGLILPELDARALPYVCLPETDTVAVEHLERGLRMRLNPVVLGYVAGAATEETGDGSSMVLAYRLLEDVCRALMPSTSTAPARWNLADTAVDDVKIGSAEVAAGVHDGIEFVEVAVPLTIQITFDRDDIGSSA